MKDPLRFVLDTNVVIDWLVFDDPYMTPLRRVAAAGTITILTHELAMGEFARVLTYPELRLNEERRAKALWCYREQTRLVEMPQAFAIGQWQLPKNFPSCRDRDDDLFLALAYHAQATALVTRDKALLKMRKRMRKFDMSILDVQQFMTLLQETPAISTTA
jgi:putative PIN family toxin of toxin-antitoxin system